MGKAERTSLIQKIQAKRGDTVVMTYLTSTRPNLEVSMAMDSIRTFYDHLRQIEKPKKTYNIDLFLMSNGGDGTVPWKLVTLLREFCNKLSVLIPYRAFSAATLTALGADEIYMHPMAMLGPTDATVSNDFNPDEPGRGKIGISVEDVSAYIALIKEDAGITHEDELVKAFNKLSDKIHPLALGNVKRSLAQSRMMAQKLLSLHMDRGKETHQINEIVHNLTSKSYYHGHPINRNEAKEQIGIQTIKDSDEELEGLIWALYEEYEKEMKLQTPFNPLLDFISKFPAIRPIDGVQSFKDTASLAFIECEKRTDFLSMEYEVFGSKDNATNAISTQVLTSFEGWKTEK